MTHQVRGRPFRIMRWPGAYGSFPVVGMPGEDRHGAVKLLEQHDPHELVRPGCGSERECEIGAPLDLGAQSVAAADAEDRGGTTAIAPAAQRNRERAAI